MLSSFRRELHKSLSFKEVVEAELESKKKICRGEFEKKKGKHREKS